MNTSGQEQEQYLKKAHEKYSSILFFDHTNCFAALGLANILAFTDKPDEAIEMYKLIHQANPRVHQALVNLAHLSLEEGKFESALSNYQLVLDTHLPGNLKISLYKAKTLFLKSDFDSCSKLLINLLAKHPESMEVKYDLGLCLLQKALSDLNKATRKVSKETLVNLLNGKQQLTQVSQMLESPKTYLRSADTEDQKVLDRLQATYN